MGKAQSRTQHPPTAAQRRAGGPRIERSARIVISVFVVASGLLQYWRLGAIETGLGPKRIVSAMSAGSLIGAALGGLAVGFAPVGFIKVVLGVVLIAAAAKVAISQH